MIFSNYNIKLKLYIVRVSFFASLTLLISSCGSHYSNDEYKVVILNESKVIQDSTIQKIINYKMPKGYMYIVRAVDSVDIRRVGATAEEYMDKDEHKHPDYLSFNARGVYIFVSKNPSLVQVRAGDEIRLLANWNGITSGKEYIKIQKTALNGELDLATLKMVDYTATTLPKYCTMSGFKNFIYEHFEFFNGLTSFISTRLEFSKLSPDSMYSKYILKPFFEFHIRIGSLWLSFILLFSIASGGILIINWLLFDLILFKLPKAITNSGKYLLGNIIIIAFLIPAINSRSMLMGSRMEDRFKLEQLNISGFEKIVFPDGNPVLTTSWWLAIIFTVLFYLNKIPKLSDLQNYAKHTPEKQRELYLTFKKENPVEAWFLELKFNALIKGGIEPNFGDNPYSYLNEQYNLMYFIGSICLGLSFWLFLPNSFTLVSIYLLIITIIVGLGFILINRLKESLFDR